MKSLQNAKERMIEEHLKKRGIENQNVLNAFRDIPRENFVPNTFVHRSYDDSPLPIGFNQTISQPFIVAIMTQILELTGTEKVLEIGTGSGYQTAILSKLASKVFSIERIKELSNYAKENLIKSGIKNFVLKIGDGSIGWPHYGPFDRIIITAGAPIIPETLKSQLKEGGKIAIPVGDKTLQTLKIIEKVDSEFTERKVLDCRFVPLIGIEGW